MELLKSYIDANIIIKALSDDVEIVKKAMLFLGDSNRRLVVSDYVELETIPKMRYFKRINQVWTLFMLQAPSKAGQTNYSRSKNPPSPSSASRLKF